MSAQHACAYGARFQASDLQFQAGMQLSGGCMLTVHRWGGGAKPGMYTCNAHDGFDLLTQACVIDDFGNLVRVPSMHSPQRDLINALRVARDCIELDRTSLLETHTGPDGLDDDGEAGVAEYDAVLFVIDAAIAKAQGGAA